MKLKRGTHCHAGKGRSSADHSIQPRDDTIEVTLANSESCAVGVRELRPLDQDPQDTSRTRPNAKRRNEDTGGDLDTERHDGEDTLHHQRDEDRVDDGDGLCWRVEHTEAGVGIVAALTTFGEEVVDKLGAAHAGVGVQEAEQRRYESD